MFYHLQAHSRVERVSANDIPKLNKRQHFITVAMESRTRTITKGLSTLKLLQWLSCNGAVIVLQCKHYPIPRGGILPLK